MPDRPILFSAPMIRALIEGRKTQTRRLAWTPARDADQGFWMGQIGDRLGWWRYSPWQRIQLGDRLWVREAVQADDHEEEDIVGVRYLADDLWWPVPNTDEWRERQYVLRCYRSTDPDLDAYKAVPPIHMPRWASRLTLTVTAARVEPLQAISEADVLAEGCPVDQHYHDTTQDGSNPHMVKIGVARWRSPRAWFHLLWDEIHGPGAWDANPEVVVLTFTVRQGNIDA